MEQLGASVGSSSDEDVTVLIVGSDPDADRICSSLAARGADVQQLSTALAVDAVASANPDVVLLVGDAARQRGALFRSQLVRRLRSREVNLVVLVEEAATIASSTLRLIDRRQGSDAVAEQVLASVQRGASQSQGTLDEVAAMVATALQRPSEPPSLRPRDAAKIVMTSRPPAPEKRPTLRVAGGIPAPARSLPPRSSSLPQQLSLAPPTSLRALAAHRIEIKPAAGAPPPPLPEATEVSLSDMRIERDRESGEVTLQRRSVPPLPAPTATHSEVLTTEVWTPRDTPTSTVAAVELDVPVATIPTLRRRSTRWIAAAAALAASLGLIVFAQRGAITTQGVAEVVPSTKASDTQGQENTALAARPGRVTATEPSGSSGTRASDDPADDLSEMQAVAEAPLAAELIDDDDVTGDEPHLVRARALCNEGHALRNRGRLGLAEAKYLQALGLFPEYPRAVAGVVRVHLTRGDGAEAVRWAERLVKMQANRSNNQLLLGDAYALSGKHHDARRHWRKSAAFGNLAARKRLDGREAVLAKPLR